MNVLRYSRNGYPISLNKVNELVVAAAIGIPDFHDPEDIHLEKETVYWADERGLLVPVSPVG